MKGPTIKDLVGLIEVAAANAAEYQMRIAVEDTESRRIVEVMENFLRIRSRLIYGGAAINAYMSPKNKFYDPRLHLPDYDFLTPDPLQDCTDLIAEFQKAGFEDVEAKLGIHEGTYKVFVNYRPAADITYMPPTLYERLLADSSLIDGLRYAGVDYLRMNMYLELSRPAGNLQRWPKIYERLLLLNKEYPLKAGRCVKATRKRGRSTQNGSYQLLTSIGIKYGAVFLSESLHLGLPDSEVVILISENPGEIAEASGLTVKRFEALGELLPPRQELFQKGKLVGVVFKSVGCDAYITKNGLKLGSIDLMIQMYYAMYFTDLSYLSEKLLCIIAALIKLEAERRKRAVTHPNERKRINPFPKTCVGHQPQMPELKKAHRKRVAEKREELERLFGRLTRKVK